MENRPSNRILILGGGFAGVTGRCASSRSMFLVVLHGRKKPSKNCWYTASRGVPLFEYEGEFGSWLLRVFIEEALALLLESRQRSNLKPLRYLRRTGVAVGFQSRSD